MPHLMFMVASCFVPLYLSSEWIVCKFQVWLYLEGLCMEYVNMAGVKVDVVYAGYF